MTDHDDAVVDLVFDIPGLADGAAEYESISDFLGAVPDPPKCEMPDVSNIRKSKPVPKSMPKDRRSRNSTKVAKPAPKTAIQYWDMPSGKCEHHRPVSDCWVCNPCKICPSILWANYFRPYPRSKKHLLSKAHVMNLEKRVREGKNIMGDDDYVLLVEERPHAQRVKAKCSHDKVRWVCDRCNPCYLCYDAITDHGPANTSQHRQSFAHRLSVFRLRLGHE